jgi:hypothetical protein
VRAFQPRLCLRIHFYTGWQFFLLLLCPLRIGYDGQCQRFSRFPDANTYRDADRNSDSNSYGNANSYSNCYCDTDSNAYCNCHSNGYTNRNSKRYAQACSNTAASPDATAAPVGRCVASDRCFADGIAGIVDAGL